MGLSSVFSTAVTGIQASETTIDVTGNNVANANTIGFKQSKVEFATQFLQTLSRCAAPTADNGGTNPNQVGLGVQVAAITPDFKQGTLQISSSPSDLAIQGNGMFIVQSTGGENLYTRNGSFATNSLNQLVTSTGQRLMGYGVDSNYNIQTTSLTPLTIPLGSSAVAKATTNVQLQGTLTPTGDVATTASIIQSGPLGDAAKTAPGAGATVSLAPTPDVITAGTTATPGTGGSLTPGATYSYKVVFADGTLASNPNTESMASTEVGPITLGAAQDSVSLSNLPTDSSGVYQTRRVYRSNNGGATYQLVGEIPDNTTTTFTDNVADGAGADARHHWTDRQLQLLRRICKRHRRSGQRHLQPSHADRRPDQRRERSHPVGQLAGRRQRPVDRAAASIAICPTTAASSNTSAKFRT